MTELTDEQIAREEKFLEGIPRLNIGALFLPPIWGPAHGMWAAKAYRTSLSENDVKTRPDSKIAARVGASERFLSLKIMA